MDQPQILELITHLFGVKPLAIEQMLLTHSGNTIYEVTLPERNIIVRLRGDDKNTFSHTVDNIRALTELGLPVPRVLTFDTSLTQYSFRYIILEKIPGRDLLYELPGMTSAQITCLAEQIVNIQHRVATLPQGTGFGWGAIGEGGTESRWFDAFDEGTAVQPPLSDVAILREFQQRLHRQRIRFQPYFRNRQPVCFLEDLTTKNVLLKNGELTGIIDFDSACFGDPLWMIGLAAGCIVNDIGRQELFYIEELCRLWKLMEEQNKIVAYYAAKRALEFLEISLVNGDQDCTNRLILMIEEWLTTLEST